MCPFWLHWKQSPLWTLCRFSSSVKVLRSRPTCHGIRRTVIDTARESFIFFFFRIIFRLDPCRTGLLQLLDLIHVTSASRTHIPKPPSRALPHGQPRSFDILFHFPSTSS